MSVFSLTYVSSAVRPFSRDALVALLDISRRNNALAEISGMLLYKEGNFMQVLEGAEGPVREIFRRIRDDPRHRGIVMLEERLSRSREFAQWTMGFSDLATVSSKPAGYVEFLDTPLSDASFTANPGRAHKLLLLFKESM